MFLTLITAIALYGVGTFIEKDEKENYSVKTMNKEQFYKEMGWE